MRFSSVTLALAMGIGVALFGTIEGTNAQTRLQKTFDQWLVECVETDKKVCGLYFKLVNPKNKRVVLSWAVVPRQEVSDGNRAVVRTPNGVVLADGVSVKLGKAEAIKITYKTCGPVNCIGELDFSDVWLKAFRSNQLFSLTYTANNGKKFTQEVSLKGFADGFTYYVEQMSAGNNPDR